MANPVNWFEIPVTDMARAKKFYNSVFDCTFQDMNTENMEYATIQGDMNTYGAAGALAKSEGMQPSKCGSVVYFSTPDLTGQLEKIKKAGGKVLVPKTSIGEHGYIAQFLDTEGNRVAMHSME